MKRLTSILVSLKIFDPDNTISLSNITLMVLIVKLALVATLDWTMMTAFFLTLLNHNSRKWFARDRSKKAIDDTVGEHEKARTF